VAFKNTDRDKPHSDSRMNPKRIASIDDYNPAITYTKENLNSDNIYIGR